MGWAKLGGLGNSRGAEGAEVERHRIEGPKAPLAPREVACGEASEEGLCPSPEFFFDFELKS